MEYYAQDPANDPRDTSDERTWFHLVDVTPLDERCAGTTYEGAAPCPCCKNVLTCSTYDRVGALDVYRLDETAVLKCKCGARLYAIELIDHDGDEWYAYAELREVK